MISVLKITGKIIYAPRLAFFFQNIVINSKTPHKIKHLFLLKVIAFLFATLSLHYSAL